MFSSRTSSTLTSTSNTPSKISISISSRRTLLSTFISKHKVSSSTFHALTKLFYSIRSIQCCTFSTVVCAFDAFEIFIDSESRRTFSSTGLISCKNVISNLSTVQTCLRIHTLITDTATCLTSVVIDKVLILITSCLDTISNFIKSELSIYSVIVT